MITFAGAHEFEEAAPPEYRKEEPQDASITGSELDQQIEEVGRMTQQRVIGNCCGGYPFVALPKQHGIVRLFRFIAGSSS